MLVGCNGLIELIKLNIKFKIYQETLFSDIKLGANNILDREVQTKEVYMISI